jgi:hypothetical protein
MSKQWVGFDLDGTLAVYDVWRGSYIGEPIETTCAIVRRLLEIGQTVKIFTARVASVHSPEEIEEQRNAITEWTTQVFGQPLESTAEKDNWMLEYYDDRAIQVEFNTGRLIQEKEILL